MTPSKNSWYKNINKTTPQNLIILSVIKLFQEQYLSMFFDEHNKQYFIYTKQMCKHDQKKIFRLSVFLINVIMYSNIVK